MKRRARVQVKLNDRRGRTLAVFTTRPLTTIQIRHVYHRLLPRLIADIAASLAPRRKR